MSMSMLAISLLENEVLLVAGLGRLACGNCRPRLCKNADRRDVREARPFKTLATAFSRGREW